MATTIGTEYDHIDITNGASTVRHPLKDASARENLVKVQDTQPQSSDNVVWIKETPESEVQVPTYAEFEEVAGDVSDLNSALNDMTTATAEDVGKVLKAKTVADGKVTEWEFGDTGVAVDPTLSVEGKAADAKVTGDKISSLKATVGYEKYDLTDFRGGYLTSSLKWLYTTGAKYKHLLFPVSAGDVVKIKATSSSGTQIGFLKSYAPSENAYAEASEVTGFTTLFNINSGIDRTFPTPSDCSCLYVLALDNGTNKTPELIEVNGIEKTASLYNITQQSQQDMYDTIGYKLFEKYPVYWGRMTSGGKWNVVTNAYHHVIIPVASGDSVHIKNGPTESAVAFLTSYKMAVVNETADLSDQDGYSDRIVLAGNAVMDFVIPSDVACLYILILNNNSVSEPVELLINDVDMLKSISDALVEIDDTVSVIPALEENNNKVFNFIGEKFTPQMNPMLGHISWTNYEWTNYGTQTRYSAHLIIPVNPGDLVRVVGDNEQGSYVGFLRTYTPPADGVTVDYASGQEQQLYTINHARTYFFRVPTDAHYLYVMAAFYDVQRLPSALFVNGICVIADSLYNILYTLASENQVKWCAMGDSITTGYYSYFDGNDEPQTSYEKSREVGWVYKTAAIKKWDITNIGIGGTGYLQGNTTGNLLCGYALARQTDFKPYNLVTLSYGINDFNLNKPIGTMEDLTSGTITTITAAMKATIEAIMTSNPACKIVVILPINESSRGDESTNWAERYSQSEIGTLRDLCNRFIAVCEYYRIAYVDMLASSFLNRLNITTLLPDGIHPSEVAHELMAHELGKRIPF